MIRLMDHTEDRIFPIPIQEKLKHLANALCNFQRFINTVFKSADDIAAVYILMMCYLMPK